MATETSEKPVTEQGQVGLWLERISIARKEQEDWAENSGAKRFCDEYKGIFGLKFQTNNGQYDVPPINEVFSYVQSDIAATYNRDPYMSVNAKAGTVMGAKLREVWLNQKWRTLKTKEELELELIDKDLIGYAFHKVGLTVQSQGKGDQLQIVDEKIYSMRVDWRDVFWNLNSKRPPVDCAWMAQRIVRPLDDVKAEYPVAQGMQGSLPPDFDEKKHSRIDYKDDIKLAVFYEIWDARSRMIYCVAEGLQDRFLCPPRPWPEYMKEFPFLMYWDFAIPGSSRPLSAIAPWEPQLLESMVLLAQAVNHAKRWNRQLIVNKGAIDGTTLDKFERGVDGAVLENTGTGKLADNVMPLDFGQLPTDFYLIMDRINAIKRETHGQPEFERGGVTKTSTRTKGELEMISTGAKGRQDRKQDRLETHLENIARHMMFHFEGNFDFEEVVKVTGDTPEDVIRALGDKFDLETGSVTFSAEDIKGEYDVEVKAGSTLPMDKQTKLQVCQTVLQMVGTMDPAMLASPFVATLIGEILDQFEIKSLQQAYKAQLEAIHQEQAVAEETGNVDAQKSQAETAKRMAQTQQISAETAITLQDVALGPMGRAEVEKASRPEPKPGLNGGGK